MRFHFLRILKTAGGVIAGGLASALACYPFVTDYNGDGVDDLAYMAGRAVGAGICVVILGLLFWPAMHAILYAVKRRTLWYYVILPLPIGFGLGMLFGRDNTVHSTAFVCNMFAVWASLFSAVVWLIRRPDRDPSETAPLESHF